MDYVPERPDINVNKDVDLLDVKSSVINMKSVLESTAITNRISVRRSSVFSDYMACRKKKWFKPKGTLKVTFIGEPAIDDGGPKREFFTGANDMPST